MARKPSLNLSINELMSHDNWSSYSVRFGSEDIFLTVTLDATIVCYWISTVRFLYVRKRPENVVVGVRTEWKRSEGINTQNFRVDILQLCVKNHCLIYQIRHAANNIPHELREFLGDNRFTFVGIEMYKISESLQRDYNVFLGERIVNASDHYRLGENNDSCSMIRELSNQVVNWDYARPSLVNYNWDDLLLRRIPVMYACADAVVCYKAGITLGVWYLAAPPRNRPADDNN